MVMWAVYSLLAFFSKPGTRKLMPFVVFLAIVLGYPLYEPVLAQRGRDVEIVALILVALAFIAFCFLYGHSSRFVALVLSVFPPIRKPIQPVAPIAQPKTLDDPVPVVIAVPRLPHGGQA